MSNILLISGPTGVGKTALSLTIATALNGEIVSADSMQIYRGMDIGTAKASKEEQIMIPHHMIDFLDPREPYSAHLYVNHARACIDNIIMRNKMPIIVGGTGLYIDGLCFERQYANAPPNKRIRLKYQNLIQERGEEALLEKLKEKDPLTAQRLTSKDIPRIMRALEVYEQTGRPFSDFQNQGYKIYDGYKPCLAVLTDNRVKLYDKINARVVQMIDEGWIEEVEELKRNGLNRNHQSAKAIGYRELFAYLDGELSKDEAIQKIQKSTRNYAKRQLTWFRRNPLSKWYNISDYTSQDELKKRIIQDMKLEENE